MVSWEMKHVQSSSLFCLPSQPLQRINASKEQVGDHRTWKTADSVCNTNTTKKHIGYACSPSYHDEILRTGQSFGTGSGRYYPECWQWIVDQKWLHPGNIHIYAMPVGRVIAGAGGHGSASHFFAILWKRQLISTCRNPIVWRMISPKIWSKKPVHIYLNNKQELEFEPLTV